MLGDASAWSVAAIADMVRAWRRTTPSRKLAKRRRRSSCGDPRSLLRVPRSRLRPYGSPVRRILRSGRAYGRRRNGAKRERPNGLSIGRLRDRVGAEHPLKADVGCRNTLFNAVPQTGAGFFGLLAETGLRHFRIELLEEDAVQTRRTIRAYQSLLAGDTTAGGVARVARSASVAHRCATTAST